jgi:hypothetical protein
LYKNYNDTAVFNKKKFLLVASIVPITTGGVFIYFQNAWWKDQKTNFNWDMKYDFSYALSLDKMGHYWSSEISADFLKELFLWTGLKQRQSLLWSGIFISTCGGIIEMKDAFAPRYGFSPSDFAADVLGAFTPLFKDMCPVLKNFKIKWGYDLIHKPDKIYLYETLPWGRKSSFMDIYERHNYYISTDISSLLANSKFDAFPKFLNLAIGFSASNIIGQANKKAKFEVYFSLDWNLEKMNIAKNKKNIKKIIHYLDYYHFPAPAVRIRPNSKVYPVNF